MWKRDIEGKFALKNDDYREVRSLRLTYDTWKALGIASECLGNSPTVSVSRLYPFLEYFGTSNAVGISKEKKFSEILIMQGFQGLHGGL
uniref:Uncharacterized protein n=1 Tax=Oscillatoriales cyanobacterium SpSt-418 TaxID=2282169 RepID=A0A7C3PFV0_9CYAN